MAKLITSNFRTHMAEQLFESVTESANTIYYAFAAKSTPWENDDAPEANGTSVRNTYYDMYDQMLFGKRMGSSDVRYMIKKNMWTSGTVYEPFNIETADLDKKQFYAVTQENNTQSQTIDYSVFKCLNNAGGAPSTVSPKRSEVTASDDLYQTADGYQWKWMFTIPNAVYNKFATSLYVPIEPNANVQANAVSGSIEAYQVVDGGRDYNSYAKGYVKSGSVAGNTQFISLSGSTDVVLTLNTISGFDFEKVNVSGDTATNGVVINIDSLRSRLTLSGISGAFQVGQTITNGTVTANITAVEYEVDSLSANTDFYKNSSIYIRSGKGAGQLRLVEEYIVTGDERRVLLDRAFTTSLDSSSVFEITPRVKVTGDGVGAEAIAIIDSNQQNKIDRIEVINKGNGYTYADVSVIANTGFVDIIGDGDTILSSSANVVPLLSPKGGHGSDPVNELFGHRIGFSLEFDGSEGGTIPADNEYRKIGIIKDPLFANVEISIESTDGSVNPTSYQDGEEVVKYDTRSSGIVLQTFVYEIHRYETLSVANGGAFSVGDTVYGYTDVASPDPDTKDVVGKVRHIDGNDVYILKDPNYTNTQSFADSEYISTLGTISAFGDAISNNEIDGVHETQTISSTTATFGGTNTVISGSDNFDRTFGYKDVTSDLPLSYDVFLNNLSVDVTVSANSFNLGALDIEQTDTVYFYVKSDTETFTAENLETGAKGEVSNRTATRLRLKNVRGTFQKGDTIVGKSSNVKSTITNVYSNVSTLDQRLIFTVEPGSEVGTGIFEGQLLKQTKTGAEGYVHSINRDDNGDVNRINLTEYKGTFNISDNFGNEEILEGENGSFVTLTAREYPSLEYGSGEVIYVETFRPIQRALTSTEKLKLIIEF